MRPVFLDFEASGLTHESYPIQVAWGSTLDNVVCEYIKPDTEWTYWDLEAEAIHGIAPEQLNDGLMTRKLCQLMNMMLDGQTVYADGLPMDSMWKDKLFEAGGVQPAFKLRNAWDLFCDAVSVRPSLEDALLNNPGNLQTVKVAIINELQKRARREVPGLRHRADVDTRHLIRTWELILEREQRERMGY